MGITRFFLCGDVMTGRGIDQVLPHPSDPLLYESYLRDARAYVKLAEDAFGPIPRRVDSAYIWGDALAELSRQPGSVRIINLETSITRSDQAWPAKGIHYRMHPGNIGCIAAARIDCCALANNHVLDWGCEGLAETLRTLDAAGIAHAGAGANATQAAAPARIDLPGNARVLVFSFGSTTSGIPADWGATGNRPGVNLIDESLAEEAQRTAETIAPFRQRGTIIVASIHWGLNWGYHVPAEQIHLAHQLVDAGADIVHGHSAHHVKALEVYRSRLILYGCGDFLTDYEGIQGYEQFRGNLALMFVADIDAQGHLANLRLVPLQMRRFRLTRASPEDSRWLCDLLNDESSPFRTHVQLETEDGGSFPAMTVRW